MRAFTKDGFLCLVSQDDNESLEHFSERGNFIVSQQPNSKEEYNKAINYSRLYMNCKHHKCSYTEEVMKELLEMQNKLNQKI